MKSNKRTECIEKLLNLTFPSIEDVLNCDDYNIYEIYLEGIKLIDEFVLLDDTTTLELEQLIEEFIYIVLTEKNKYLFFYNPVSDNLTIFLINRYKNKLSDKFLFNKMFHFGDKNNFRRYIYDNMERLRSFISQNEFCISGVNNVNDSKIHISFFSNGADCYYFYTEFKDVLRLSDDDWSSLFERFKPNQLYDLISTALGSDDEMSTRIIKSKAVSDFVCSGLKVYEGIFDLYIKLLKRNMPISISNELVFMEQFDRQHSSTQIELKYGFKYFYKLGVLEKLSKNERKSHPYYQECYDIFYDVMKNRIKDLADEEDYIIMELFERILDGQSFYLITSINNKGSLILYYKTNFFAENTKNISASEIDKLSLEQWTYIKSNFSDHFDYDTFNSFSNFEANFPVNRISLSDNLLELAVTVGFDFLKFIIEKNNLIKNNVRGYVISELKQLISLGLLNDSSYNEQLKCFIIDFINDGNLDISLLSNYVSIFTYLYKKNYPDVSLDTLKLLISNDKSLGYIVNSDGIPKFIYNRIRVRKDIDTVFDEYLEYLKASATSISKLGTDYDTFTNIEVILLELLDRKISSEVDGTTKNLEYFYKLDVLKKTPKKEREKHPYYDECYKVYFDVMKAKIKDLADEDIYVVKKLFHRIINGDSFLLITSIDNRASLLLYYKTNFYFKNKVRLNFQNKVKSPISVDDISKLSSKQWIYIGSNFANRFDDKFSKSNLKSESVFFPGCIYLQDYFVDVVCELGFDFFYSLTSNKRVKNEVCVNVMKELQAIIVSENFKKQDYYEKMKSLLIDFINDDKMDAGNFKKYISVFNYLYENEYSSLTFQRVKRLASDISALLFPNNYHIKGNLDKLDFVAKGEPFIEKTKGVVLYNKYRRRISSSIPNYTNNYNGLEFGTVDMHDENIISNGIGKYIYPDNKRASSCLTPNGKAASCLEHGAIDCNGRFFYVKHNGKIVAYSWMWRNGDVLCFDNIEHTEEYLNLVNKEKSIYDIYMMAARSIVDISKRTERKPIKVVVLGRNPIDVKNICFDTLPDVSDKYGQVFKPKGDDKLYLKDSENKQLLLIDDSTDGLSFDDVLPVYLVPRGEVKQLGYNMDRVNAIYFDYCLENCIKYNPLMRSDFKSGYVGDDWFYGEKVDGSKVLYESLDDDRRKEEIRRQCY